MGYKIVYGPQPGHYGDIKEPPQKIKWLTAVFFLALCLCVKAFSPEGTSLLQQYLVPGEPTATEQAFLQMIEDFQSGEPIGDCVTSFCRNVVENKA